MHRLQTTSWRLNITIKRLKMTTKRCQMITMILKLNTQSVLLIFWRAGVLYNYFINWLYVSYMKRIYIILSLQSSNYSTIVLFYDLQSVININTFPGSSQSYLSSTCQFFPPNCRPLPANHCPAPALVNPMRARLPSGSPRACRDKNLAVLDRKVSGRVGGRGIGSESVVIRQRAWPTPRRRALHHRHRWKTNPSRRGKS